MIIPNIRKNKSHVPNHEPDVLFQIYGKIIPARDPKQWRGAKVDETSGGDDDDDDAQMRAQRSRHMRAHESRHTRAHI